MRRRDFIAVIAGSVAWPLAVRAQQERMRRIGLLIGQPASDPEYQLRTTAFREELGRLGWIEGRNAQLKIVGGAVAGEARRHVMELVASSPEVIMAAAGSPGVLALQQATQTIPVVFANLTDPVGVGVVTSLSRPSGNITGFMPFEYGISVKWLELLKEIDPRVRRAGILRDPTNPTGIGFLAAMQGVAPSLGVELVALNIKNADDVERSVSDFARDPNGGLVVTLTAVTILHRALIAAQATKHRLAAVYPHRFFAANGGLISYGPDVVDQFRRAAGYVDRILRGEKPIDLPVQAPTKYELAINLKTAKELGLTVPLILQQRADEVIE